MTVYLYFSTRKMRSHRARTKKLKMPLLIISKVNTFCKGYFGSFITCWCASKIVVLCLFKLSNESNNIFVNVADGLAYSALLKNELLGAGIEKIQDPQTEDRRLQPSTPEKRSLFTVWTFHLIFLIYWIIKHIYYAVSKQRHIKHALEVLSRGNKKQNQGAKCHNSVSVQVLFSSLCCFNDAGRECDVVCLCVLCSIHSIPKGCLQTMAPTSPPTPYHLSATKGRNTF